jgi:hypothetical protein
MDPVLSPIGTCLSVGTPVTTADSLTVPSGGMTAPIAEAGSLTVPPGGPTVAPPKTPQLLLAV